MIVADKRRDDVGDQVFSSVAIGCDADAFGHANSLFYGFR